MTKFQVSGKVSFYIEIDITTKSEENAIKKAIELIKDMYNLDAHGGYHNPEKVHYSELDAVEYNNKL